MKTTINNLDILIEPERDNQGVIVQAGKVAFRTMWNKGRYRWVFADTETPAEIKKSDNEISNFIINSEKKS